MRILRDRKQYNKIHRCLRILIILINSLSLVIGFLVFVPIAQVYKNLNYQCPLYSSIYLKAPVQSSSNISLLIVDEAKSTWSDYSHCEYLISLGIFNAFICVLSMFYFIMFSMKDSDLIENDDCLLIPWILINLVFTLLILVGAFIASFGLASFCSDFLKSLEAIHQGVNFNCKKVQYLEWKNSGGDFVYDYLVVSTVALWVLLILYLLVDLTILMRIGYILKSIKNQKNEQEALIIKYARILKMKRLNKSYDIQLPLKGF